MNFKSIDDLSSNYLANEGLADFPYSRLWAKKVTQVNGADLRIRAKLTYFLLHPTLFSNRGFLPEDLTDVALDLRMKESHLLQDVEDLCTVGVLRKDPETGFLYDKRMAKDRGAKLAENSEKIQKKNITLVNSKICPRESQSEPWIVEKSRVFSSAALAAGTKNDCATDSEKRSGFRPEGETVPFSRLTKSDLEIAISEYEARPDFPTLAPFAVVYAKFVEWHTSNGTENVTLTEPKGGLRGWLKRQKPAKPAKSAAVPASPAKELPVMTCETNKKGEDVWKIGSRLLDLQVLYEVFQEMPVSNEAEAHRYLCQAVGYEWNTRDALARFADGWIFTENEDGTWRGATYSTPEELEYCRKIVAEEKAAKEAKEVEAKAKRDADEKDREEARRVAEAERLREEEEERNYQEFLANREAERRQFGHKAEPYDEFPE